mmetsp:Transcript_946/g.2597  ORF Transcript_946/g.2597 Transcript_946/m.2597 type:complete len:172 (+) Transcript_946:403-918(+)
MLSHSTSTIPQYNAKDTKAAAVRIVQHDVLYEKSVFEHLAMKNIYNRVEAFEDWLGSQPETVIAVVGHSGFFRYMTGVKMQNIAVWKTTFSGAQRWSTPEMIVRGYDAKEQAFIRSVERSIFAASTRSRRSQVNPQPATIAEEASKEIVGGRRSEGRQPPEEEENADVRVS